MRVICMELYPAPPGMQLPTWKELVGDTGRYGSNKMKVVSRVSINPVHPHVLCHQNTKDLLTPVKTTAVHGSECLVGRLLQTTVTTLLKSQGIYLTNVQLTAEDIKLKLNSSRLLKEPFRVRASAQINEQDLLSSLSSPLVAKLVAEISSGRLRIDLSDINLSLKKGALQLQPDSLPKILRVASTSYNKTDEDQRTALKLQVEDEGSLSIFSNNTETASDSEPAYLKKFWLGPDVSIKTLEVQRSGILLDGHFLVRP
ncbi:uncharacterized protein LOC131069303 isoform X2 [Cryptomeria japonica]|uniref:uncharacterized protein LOC131069303 isoform X2 n=1 Tax=Cryptomeria japonica TaxID=3369 RepID=UPI0025AB9B0B|nr:uncharacterized protein LOC131069303 isoform X2 [Cryptomeria japonica]